MKEVNKASFSIENYVFDKVFIDLDNKNGEEVSLDFDPSGVFCKDKSTYELTFNFKTYSKDKEVPFVHIRCTGVFKFQNVKSLEEIPSYFYMNSIALLFPYLRAFISIVTIQANIVPLILPTLNLTSLATPLKEKTKEI